MTIKYIDRPFCNHLSLELNTLIEGYLMENYPGLAVSRERGSFSSHNMSVRYTIAVIDPEGVAITPEVEDFKAYASMYGLKSDDLGKKFLSRGREYEIIGLKMKNRKYPIICQSTDDGARYKMPERLVVDALKSIGT